MAAPSDATRGATNARVADLPLVIESYELERREVAVSSQFTRVTTTVRLRGGGEEGVGEDVTYEAALHDEPPRLPLAGVWETLDAFSAALRHLDLFASPPSQAAYLDYRRWAYESAALDLALRQAERSLADALGREAREVRYVASLRLPEPPDAAPLRAWLEHYPTLRFKLDPLPSWDGAFLDGLRELPVDVVDLKGAYKGTVVDNPADARLYARVAEAFPDAWIEDPDLDDADAARALEPHRERITGYRPIHSVADVDALPFPPRMLNVKPSRFGSLRRLFDFYDYCAERGITTYGGGQFELGPGRGQIQYLASLFSPDAPNDVAPGGFNEGGPRPGLPPTPLPPQPSATGFRWGE